ncbi:hypothetical protein DNTS_022734 [Danionella cerebrum]|uniref:Ig-like domain-containing protein n=1 Tax=Danionella cerebrum TaxID=2873325 RepID=A0A553MY44_9TELE|nr:hypothetical protein DNTS_022734 [Danionella translucida]
MSRPLEPSPDSLGKPSLYVFVLNGSKTGCSHQRLCAQSGLERDPVTMSVCLASFIFLIQTWRCTAIDPIPRIDGQQASMLTVQENVTRHFICQSEGWDSQAPPLLTWYLDGERQSQVSGSRGVEPETMTSSLEKKIKFISERKSTYTLRPKRGDRELVCSASNPARGESYNASIKLNVQFQPEILQVEAQYSESSDSAPSLLILALVRSNPPAFISWVDQTGRVLANSSDFLFLDSRSLPWLVNHSLHLTLSTQHENISLNASNSLGSAHSNLTLTEFMQSRVELPVFGIVTGGVAGFVTLFILSLMVFCLLQKDKSKAMEDSPEARRTNKCGDGVALQVNGVYLRRENMSLPSHLMLNDDLTLCKGHQSSTGNTLEKKIRTQEDEDDLSAAYAAPGFARYPMVGYIYKVSSTSSDEIWL